MKNLDYISCKIQSFLQGCCIALVEAGVCLLTLRNIYCLAMTLQKLLRSFLSSIEHCITFEE